MSKLNNARNSRPTVIKNKNQPNLQKYACIVKTSSISWTSRVNLT